MADRFKTALPDTALPVSSHFRAVQFKRLKPHFFCVKGECVIATGENDDLPASRHYGIADCTLTKCTSCQNRRCLLMIYNKAKSVFSGGLEVRQIPCAIFSEIAAYSSSVSSFSASGSAVRKCFVASSRARSYRYCSSVRTLLS